MDAYVLLAGRIRERCPTDSGGSVEDAGVFGRCVRGQCSLSYPRRRISRPQASKTPGPGLKPWLSWRRSG